MTCRWTDDHYRNRYREARRNCKRQPVIEIEILMCIICDQIFDDVDDVVEHVLTSDCFKGLGEIDDEGIT